MRGHRPFTYVILAVNALFLIWLIGGVGGAASQVQDCSGLVKHAKDMCEAGNAGTAVGTGIGAALIVFLWGFVDIILGVLWLVTNGRYKEKKAALAPAVVASQPAQASGVPPRPDDVPAADATAADERRSSSNTYGF